ncbi:hypothetical protein G3I59_16790 [Amycolatopsis rubida]|uniref:Uncharacterized protein n=1 Tax=Amycolatopsis rubida TaxID=112413 RepID=A0ABX0BS23_9PSEU|nr:hypothetical protein [Amycolatopsis sp. M39]MYW92213.1 hypothetical protein [Amycolatopsis rubida]NEC57200.1 hypothetical protein [Amycolatopsis rubida]OAP27066.1 hypothetical protein A4R44_01871 [Amycolatopsis sp. M39]
MTNDAVHERRGATRFGRLASRALFVVGGALAATAAAWAVSSPAASADPVDASVTPVTDATAAGIGDVTDGVGRFAGEVTGAVQGLSSCGQGATTWSEPGTSRPACSLDQLGRAHRDDLAGSQEAAGKVSDAVSGLGQHAVVKPVERTLGSLEHIARKPEDARQVIADATTPPPAAQDFGRKLWDLLDPSTPSNLVDLPKLPSAPAESEQAPTPGIPEHPAEAEQNLGAATMTTSDALQSVFSAMDAQSVDPVQGTELPQRHHGDRGLPGAPFSPAQLPVAPLSIPNSPAGGSTAPGGHLDGLNFGVPSWVVAAVDNAVAGSTRTGLAHTPRTPGEQPGVTPD